MRREGEIVIFARKNGKSLTTDALRETLLHIPCREVASTLPCGFQMDWVCGEREGDAFDLNVGANCGSAWMTFHYKGRSYCLKVDDILAALFDFADEGSR